MDYLPIAKMRDLLFEDKLVFEKIIIDYKISPKPKSGTEFGDAIIAKLGQQSVCEPEKQEISNSQTFKAAVLAISSDSGSWTEVHNKRKKLCDTLGGYNPGLLADTQDIDAARLKLGSILGGQKAKSNSASILNWAEILTRTPNFYEDVVVSTYKEIAEDLSEFGLRKYPMAVLCMAGIFGNPVNRWKGLMKFPGMRVAIGCEFLRNLRWSGFKPDRHIIRALSLWEPELKECHQANVEEAYGAIKRIIDTGDRTTLIPIKAAVYAIQATPEEFSYSEADNLLWAFVSNMVNYREKEIFDIWLKKRLHLNDIEISDYVEFVDSKKLREWPDWLVHLE